MGTGPVLRTETVVEAPPEQVWAVLTDLEGWDGWNPTLFAVRGGPARPGAEVRMKLRLGPFTVPMRQQIRTVDPPRELTWRSKQMVPASAFDVVRSFRLEPIDGGRTRLVQTETYSGFLAGVAFRLIGKPVLRGYEEIGRALADALGQGKG